jgi:hypothetical protein
MVMDWNAGIHMCWIWFTWGYGLKSLGIHKFMDWNAGNTYVINLIPLGYLFIHWNAWENICDVTFIFYFSDYFSKIGGNWMFLFSFHISMYLISATNTWKLLPSKNMILPLPWKLFYP